MMRKLINLVSEASYHGLHTAPNREDDAPLYDLSGVFPDDVYSPKGYRYGHTGGIGDKQTHEIVMQCRGQPDREVTIYRAIPSHIEDPDFHSGDWVTLSRDYAERHGESNLGGAFQILSKVVPAKDVFNNGDALVEWGYDPE